MFAVKFKRDDRAAPRLRLDAVGTARTADDAPRDVRVSDLSRFGCFLEAPNAATVGSIVSIGLAGIGQQQAFVMRADPRGLGCEFTLPLTATELTLVLSCEGTVVPFRRG